MSIDKFVFEHEGHKLLKKAGFLSKTRRQMIKKALDSIDPIEYNAQLEKWHTISETYQRQKKESKRIPLEADEQKKVVAWFRKRYGTAPESHKIIMIRNDGTRTAAEKTEQVSMGICAGAADLYIPHLHLWLEMKRINAESSKNGGLSEKQIEFRDWVTSIGDAYIVGYGHDDAIDKILTVENELKM